MQIIQAHQEIIQVFPAGKLILGQVRHTISQNQMELNQGPDTALLEKNHQQKYHELTGRVIGNPAIVLQAEANQVIPRRYPDPVQVQKVQPIEARDHLAADQAARPELRGQVQVREVRLHRGQSHPVPVAQAVHQSPAAVQVAREDVDEFRRKSKGGQNENSYNNNAHNRTDRIISHGSNTSGSSLFSA